MSLLFYGVVKYIVYSIWCYAGLRFISPTSATLRQSTKFGAIRWLLGLFFGLSVFFLVGSISKDDALLNYIIIYTPLRLVEWGIMAFLLIKYAKWQIHPNKKWIIVSWIFIGILISFLSDLVSPEGLNGKFCIGRCLC